MRKGCMMIVSRIYVQPSPNTPSSNKFMKRSSIQIFKNVAWSSRPWISFSFMTAHFYQSKIWNANQPNPNCLLFLTVYAFTPKIAFKCAKIERELL